MIRNRHSLLSAMKWALTGSTALFVLFVLMMGTTSASASPFTLSQTVPVAAAATPIIDRLSWGAIIAGALLALIIELALNLLGIALNFNSIKPRYEGESASPSQLATREIIWVAVSTLIALFTGGAVAGRFATSPERIDGTLHGLVVWAVVTIVTLLLLTTTIGRILSGTATLIGQGITLAGHTAGAVAQGVGSVAQGVGSVAQGAAQGVASVAQGAASVASSAVQGAAGVASSAAQGAANAAQSAANTAQNAGVDVNGAARNVSQTVTDTVQDAVGNVSPELKQAMQQRETVRQAIIAEGRKLLEQAGVSTDDVQNKAQGAVADVQKAAQDAVRDPQNAGQILGNALTRVFQTGQGVASQVDRQSVIDIMVQRSHLTPEQADQQLKMWEQRYNDVTQQTGQAIDKAKQQAGQLQDQVSQKASQLQDQVSQKASQLQDQAQHKLEQARADAERMAREAAQATAKAISRIALAAFFAILVGGIAAGIGGFIGTPDDVVTSGVAVPAQVIPAQPTSLALTPFATITPAR